MTEQEMLDDMRRKERQAERRAIVRMVKTYRANMWANGRNAVNEGRLQACDDILIALAKMGKA